MFDARSLAELDADLAGALAGERARQEATLELIASENYVSPRVLEAQGSSFTNKWDPLESTCRHASLSIL